MGNPHAAELQAALRMLPSTDDLLTCDKIQPLLPEIGRSRATSLVRAAIEHLRNELTSAIADRTGRTETYSKESLLLAAANKCAELWETRRRARLHPVINATGVVIHTNLGRAPLSEKALKALTAAAGYCALEYDLASGGRGKRGEYAESLLTEITGAESALIVNNCAAAAYLVLTVFAKGGEAVVSRGELVEIGGDFRVPDVLAQSGATLKEIGTTNRTKLSDYEKAIGENTKVLVRVHPSNYKIVGFTAKPSLAELAQLAHKKGILLYEDAGSGALFDLRKFGLSDEPVISRSIADGADIVTFSGDKLVGAAQAGIIVGRKHLIEQIRKHPLYRALRVGKLIYAVLEATIEAYLSEDAERSIPVLQMLGLRMDELEMRTTKFDQRLRERLGESDECEIAVISGESVVGGGSAPDAHPETVLLAIKHRRISPGALERRLRAGETPVIARIENDKVLLDLRTVQENDEDRLFEMLLVALG
ncbi:MAG TPA: L-seryl-tRNA(Sec) selenium transferase [Pyrinomonadaceae bacterium]|nr:L-seryl-tRNA(Sec) selenium transferase [Pyrinomonadaceae bacterium]